MIAAGFASETGPRQDNQDFGGVHLGSATERARHGVLAAVADGVSGGKEGRAAAELAIRALLEGFYAMPDTLGPARAMQVPLAAYNRWLHAMGRGDAMANAVPILAGEVVVSLTLPGWTGLSFPTNADGADA